LEIQPLIDDISNVSNDFKPQIVDGSIQVPPKQHRFDAKHIFFNKQLGKEDAIPMHQACNTSVLSFTVDLVEWKVENGITNTTFNRLLNLMKGQLKLTTLPFTSDQTTTTLTKFGLIYNRIGACKCNGMIYYGERTSPSSIYLKSSHSNTYQVWINL
jgi:hypothetical protein